MDDIKGSMIVKDSQKNLQKFDIFGEAISLRMKGTYCIVVKYSVNISDLFIHIFIPFYRTYIKFRGSPTDNYPCVIIIYDYHCEFLCNVKYLILKKIW